MIEAGNSWMAGTGFLGEVAADGTREVGVFWSEATGWPLVHDEDGETAIRRRVAASRSPGAGRRSTRSTTATACTSCSGQTTSTPRSTGWSGWAPPSSSAADDEVEMADPDGNEFRLR